MNTSRLAVTDRNIHGITHGAHSFDSKKFMRWAMITPLALPVLILLLGLLVEAVPELRALGHTGLYGFGQFMLMATAFAIVPYPLFFAFSWIVIGRLDQAGAIKYVVGSPFIFFCFELFFLLIAFLVEPVFSGRDHFHFDFAPAFLISAFVFPVGYGYVALVLVVHTLARKYYAAKAGKVVEPNAG